ncbi:MAG TPA: Rrf2 family transcriptional regulator [Acidobacteriota bacterium]|nr:Rrf2 family transcriptional regulator [Acidobacteriota bacterium]
MKITSLEEYGLRCMLQLALHAPRRPMTVNQIAANEGLTPEYAGKLLNLLRQQGLVDSVRGRNGGFVLARTADDVNLGEIVLALSNQLFDAEYCERHAGAGEVCVHETACALRPVWSTLSEHVSQLLESITLADLLRSEREMCRELQPAFEAVPDLTSETQLSAAPTLHKVQLPESS